LVLPALLYILKNETQSLEAAEAVGMCFRVCRISKRWQFLNHGNHRTRHGGTVAASAASVLLDHFAGPSAAALCFHYACRLLTWQGASVEKRFRFGDVQSTFAFGQLDVVESAGDAPFRIGGPTPGGWIGLLQLDSHCHAML